MRRTYTGVIGPVSLICLYYVSSVSLSAANITALLVVAALSLFLALSKRGRVKTLSSEILPFIFVYCAVLLEPGAGVLRESALTPYRAVLFVIVVLGTLIALYMRLKGRTSQADVPKGVGRWVIVVGVFGAVFYTLLIWFVSAIPGKAANIFATNALILSCVLIYFSSRGCLAGGEWTKWAASAFVGLFAIAALSGVVRLSSFYFHTVEAERLIEKKMTPEARVCLDKAEDAVKVLAVNAAQARVNFYKGLSYHVEGNKEEALGALEAAENLDDKMFDVYKLKGEIYALKGRWQEAIDAYERARSLDSSKVGYYPFLALAYSWTRQWERGSFLKDYSGPLGKGVSGADNLAVLARGLNKWGHYVEAEELCEKAIYRGRRKFDVYLQRGIAREGLGRIAEAEADYKRALSMKPGLAIGAYGRLEDLYKKDGRDTEAHKMRGAGLRLETKQLDIGRFTLAPYVYWLKDYAVFHQNGSAAAPVLLYRGRFRLRLTLRGEPSRGEYPVCVVKLDSRIIGEISVDATEWKSYELKFEVADADVYNLEFAYVNDLYLPGQDRNLFMKDATLERVK